MFLDTSEKYASVCVVTYFTSPFTCRSHGLTAHTIKFDVTLRSIEQSYITTIFFSLRKSFSGFIERFTGSCSVYCNGPPCLQISTSAWTSHFKVTDVSVIEGTTRGHACCSLTKFMAALRSLPRYFLLRRLLCQLLSFPTLGAVY
jgi:hypothetical protein